MINQDILSLDQLSTLRVELSHLSMQLQDDNQDIPLQFEGLDPETLQARSAAMAEAIRALRDAHGGERLKHPIQIITDDVAIAELKTEILPRPDIPAIEIPESLNGLVEEYAFGANTCKISTEGEGKRRKNLKAYVSDPAIRSAAIELGVDRRAAKIRIRRLGEGCAMLEITEIVPIAGMPQDGLADAAGSPPG